MMLETRKCFALLITCIFVAVLVVSCAPDGIEEGGYSWSLQYEVEDFDFWDISALDGENAWAAGFDKDYNGAVYCFDGKSWEKSNSFEGKTSAVLALDEEHVWAAGDRVYFFDGKSWGEQYQPEESINDISAIDTNNVWAVGDEGGIYFFDGSSWTRQFQAREGMFGISAIDREHVWAVGKGEDILFNNGSTWDRQFGLLGTTLFSICGVEDDLVWAVGSHKWIYPVFESDAGYPHSGYIALFDGSSWKRSYRADESIFDISAPDKDYAWASGERHIYFHDGSSWVKQFSYERGVYQVFAPDSEHVWVVGGPRIYSGER